MRTAAELIAADAADAAAAWWFGPSGRLARLRCEKLFAAERAAALARGNAPVVGRCPITGAKTVTFGTLAEAIAPAAECDYEGLSHEPAVFSIGRPVAAVDFPHWAALARQRALAAQCEGCDEDTLRAMADLAGQLPPPSTDESLRHVQSIRGEVEGPQIDADAQFSGPEVDFLAAPVGMFADFWEGEAHLREVNRAETGRVLSVEAAAERFAAFRLQCEQTERIARACEAAGLYCFCIDPAQATARPEDSADRKVRPSLTFVPVGQPEKAITLPNVERWNAFPTVSASRRASDVRSVRYWLDRHIYCRMMTITSGTRYRDESRLENLNAENKRLHSAIGALVRHRWFRAHGRADALGMEFGTPAPFMGSWHLHHHGHLIWEPVTPPAKDWRRFRERIETTDAAGERVVCRDLRHPKARLARFRRWIRLRMAALMRYEWKEKGFVWRERDRGVWASDEIHCELGRQIQNAAEACKYPIKPGDLDVLLEEAGPAAVRTYVEQAKGLRLFTAYGEFKKLRSTVKNEGRRFVAISKPDGKVVEIRRNWNLSGADIIATRERARRRQALRYRLSPAVLEKRRQKELRRLEGRARRPLFRLFRIHEAETRARAVLAGPVNVSTYTRQNAILAACADEKLTLHRELRELLQNCPHSLQELGISDQIAAPWLADLRSFLFKDGTFSDVSAISSHVQDENAGKTEKKTVEKAAKRPVMNRVIARTAPFASGAWRVSQPALAVFGYAGDFAALRAADRRVGELADATSAHIAAALRAQARMDALPPERTRTPRHAPARALRGSHYPHNSWDGAAPPAEQAEFWADPAEIEALFASPA